MQRGRLHILMRAGEVKEVIGETSPSVQKNISWFAKRKIYLPACNQPTIGAFVRRAAKGMDERTLIQCKLYDINLRFNT